MLQHGAKFVYAVDVGYGQLDWKIRSSEHVKTIEKTNLKICTKEDIYSENEPMADLLVSDLSFISLTKVLPNLKTLMNMVVIDNVLACVKELGYIIKGLTYSSIKGPAGNIEYLVWLATSGEEVEISVEDIVNSAHENLN